MGYFPFSLGVYPDLWGVKSSLEKQGGGLGWFPAHKSHSGWDYTVGKSRFSTFWRNFPDFQTGFGRAHCSLPGFWGRNLEIKLTDHLLEQWIYQCLYDGSNTGLKRIYGNLFQQEPAQANVPCRSLLSMVLSFPKKIFGIESVTLCFKTRTKL